MNKIPVFLILFLIMLVSCTVPETEVPTQTPETSTPLPLLTMTEVQNIGDGGLISGKPCAAPCFFGIKISETPFDQVISMLKENKINACVINDQVSVLCGERVLVEGDPSTNLTNNIAYYPNIAASLDEIISIYGSPDAIQVIPTSTPETPKTVVLLMFNSLQMRISLSEIDGREYPLSGSSEIEYVNYFDETIYAKMNKNSFSQPWHGYGTYQPDEDP